MLIIKEKQNIKNILIILGIIIIALLLLIGVRTQSSRNGKLSTNINSSKIVQIKLIGKELQDSRQSTFWLGTGYVKFYPKKESVYGKETNNLNYAVNLYQGDSVDKSDGQSNRIGINGTPKNYYKWVYQDYLEIFDKIRVSKIRLLYGARTIILDKKKLQRIYPTRQKANGQISWFYDAINQVNDPMVSLRIILDGERRPISVAAAAKSSPGYYRKLYRLSYNNDVSAYNRGFNKMLESIKNTPKQEAMDD